MEFAWSTCSFVDSSQVFNLSLSVQNLSCTEVMWSRTQHQLELGALLQTKQHCSYIWWLFSARQTKLAAFIGLLEMCRTNTSFYQADCHLVEHQKEQLWKVFFKIQDYNMMVDCFQQNIHICIFFFFLLLFTILLWCLQVGIISNFCGTNPF